MDGQATPATDRAGNLARWIAFIHLPGAGLARRQEMLAQFGSIDAIFDSSPGLLKKYLSGNPDALAALRDGPDLAALEPALAWLAEPGHHLVTFTDPDYPPLLRQIPDPPLALYVLGDRACLSTPQLAVVGSRNPTPGGRENARAFARALAEAGLTITSGLALGIDGEAHRGALEADGRTIAVTGTGLDRVYPATHRALAHEIAARGALVSEFAIGSPPRAEHFPVRNRIISGLSLGTLVVEAAERSGSLISARLAGEQGREVFAIPGSIQSPLSRGCHRLIRQGAKLVETAQDILEELSALAGFQAAAAPVTAASAPPLDEAADATSLSRGPRLDPIGEAADATSLSRGPRLDPIGEAADATNQTKGRTSEASRASESSRGPRTRVPGVPPVTPPIDEAADATSLSRGPRTRVPDVPPVTPPIGDDARRVLEAFGHDSAGVDQLVTRSGLTADAVSSILLQLELAALVAPCGGGRYQPITRSQGSGE
jgi:DNA processing protein